MAQAHKPGWSKTMRQATSFLSLLLSAGLVACASSNSNNSHAPDAGADAQTRSLALLSVSPSSGPLAGSTSVDLTGSGFAAGLSVTFGSAAATDVQVLGPDRATCTTPAGDAAGPVTVRVALPGGESSQLLGAYSYVDPSTPDVERCRLARPASTSAAVQTATEPLYGEVWAAGITDHTGQGGGITAEVGYGPTGSDPATSTEWSWSPAVYASDPTAESDEYVASLTVAQAGSYDYAFRFAASAGWHYCDLDGSEGGYDAAQAGQLTVTESAQPQPDWCGLIAPLSLQVTAGETTPAISGQVFASGVTEGAGAGAGLVAELGFGPAGTHPAVDPGWQFTSATYSSDVGNNDAYEATLTPLAPGTFDYAYRFQADGGPWIYCDSNGTDDGYSASYAGSLTVTGQPAATVDWCTLQWPAATQTPEGVDSELIFGRVYVQGITNGNGQGQGLQSELGYGAPGSDPATDASWHWIPAQYNVSVDGLSQGDLANDEYMARLNVSQAGSYAYAYRFSADGGASWLFCDLDGAETPADYDAAQAGALTVTPSTGIALTSVDRPRGSLLGGSPVLVFGAGFTAATTVSFGGALSPSVTVVSATRLDVTTPPGPLGAVDVTVSDPGAGSATLTDGFEYVLAFVPTLDGDLSEWDPALRVAQNGVASDWTDTNGTNDLRALYVAFDDANLYLGISGVVEPQNAIVAYLDVDFGAAPTTGLADMSGLTDNTGNLDAALAGTLHVTAAGFGADYALGSKGMAEVLDGLDDAAGWRGLSTPTDLAWLTGTVDVDLSGGAGNETLECAIPLGTLLPSGVPSAGATLALVVKISDSNGAAYANQTLPEEDTGATVSQVYTFRIFPPGQF